MPQKNEGRMTRKSSGLRHFKNSGNSIHIELSGTTSGLREPAGFAHDARSVPPFHSGDLSCSTHVELTHRNHRFVFVSILKLREVSICERRMVFPTPRTELGCKRISLRLVCVVELHHDKNFSRHRSFSQFLPGTMQTPNTMNVMKRSTQKLTRQPPRTRTGRIVSHSSIDASMW